jgi:hypothetical protein
MLHMVLVIIVVSFPKCTGELKMLSCAHAVTGVDSPLKL